MKEEFPVFLVLVDLTGTEEFLDSVKSSILALVEALPISSKIGIFTFGEKLGIFDLKAEEPNIRNILIPEEGPSSVGIEEVLPFNRMFVNVRFFFSIIFSSRQKYLDFFFI